MKERQHWGKFAGLALHVLIGGLLILTGSQKVLRSAPPEALVRYGLGEQARLIGAGAVLAALLLLHPRTRALGLLLASSFWGGAICIHMAHGEPYLFQAAVLVLVWAGAYLRDPAPLNGFSGLPGNDVGRAVTRPGVERRPGLWHYGVSANTSRTTDCAHADKCQYIPNRAISPGSRGWAADSPLRGSAADSQGPCVEG